MRHALALLLLFLPLTAAAQTNDVTFFLGGVDFGGTTNLVVFAPEDFSADLRFENGRSVSLAFNHFWRDRFSTEFAVIGMTADPTVHVESGPINISIDGGTADFGAITAAAQWHFRPGARVMPYVGGGLALVSGEIESEVEEDDVVLTETVDLEGAATILLNAGVNIRINERWLLAIDVKVIPYTAEVDTEDLEGEEFVDEIYVHPQVVGFGIRYRF